MKTWNPMDPNYNDDPFSWLPIRDAQDSHVCRDGRCVVPEGGEVAREAREMIERPDARRRREEKRDG